MTNKNYHSFSKNTHGHDYVVADLHGCFHVLDMALDSLNFDRSRDRLFVTGDMINRGPFASSVLHYLRQPWFYATRGNHEQMFLKHWCPKERRRAWEDELSIGDYQELYERVSALPYALDFDTDIGRIGVLHAELPNAAKSWAHFTHTLKGRDSQLAREFKYCALWDDERLNTRNTNEVKGLSRLFCGHRVQYSGTPLKLGNSYYLDTGLHKRVRNPASMIGCLTVVSATASDDVLLRPLKVRPFVSLRV